MTMRQNFSLHVHPLDSMPEYFVFQMKSGDICSSMLLTDTDLDLLMAQIRDARAQSELLKRNPD